MSTGVHETAYGSEEAIEPTPGRVLVQVRLGIDLGMDRVGVVDGEMGNIEVADDYRASRLAKLMPHIEKEGAENPDSLMTSRPASSRLCTLSSSVV